MGVWLGSRAGRAGRYRSKAPLGRGYGKPCTSWEMGEQNRGRDGGPTRVHRRAACATTQDRRHPSCPHEELSGPVQPAAASPQHLGTASAASSTNTAAKHGGTTPYTDRSAASAPDVPSPAASATHLFGLSSETVFCGLIGESRRMPSLHRSSSHASHMSPTGPKPRSARPCQSPEILNGSNSLVKALIAAPTTALPLTLLGCGLRRAQGQRPASDACHHELAPRRTPLPPALGPTGGVLGWAAYDC